MHYAHDYCQTNPSGFFALRGFAPLCARKDKPEHRLN